MTTTSGTLRFEPLLSSNFVTLLLAQVVSKFGDPITLVALAYVSYVRTGSALITALAVVIVSVPNVIFGIFGGAIADAFGLRRSMIACDLARVVLLATVPVILAAGMPLALAYALVFGAAVCASIFNPARLALVPQVVGVRQLPAANALVYSSDRAVEVIGALVGGVLVAVAAERAFYIDALTFLVSAVLLSRLRIDQTLRPLAITALGRDALDGVRFLWHNAILRANTAFSLVCQLAIPIVASLTPVLIFQRFAAGNTALGAAQFGVAEAAIAVGAVAGGLSLPRHLARHHKGAVILVGFGLYGATLMALALAPTFEVATILFALSGVANVVFYVPNVTISQELTPPDLRARVFGARIALLNLTWLPLIVLSGALADVVGVSLLIAIAGGLTLCAAIVGALIPRVREIP